MAKLIYGVLTATHGHMDTSHTEKAAKAFATRAGYTTVTARPEGSYNAFTVAVKEGGKWKSVQ